MHVAFPPEVDVTTLDFGDERSRGHRSHLFRPTRRFPPAPQSGVRKNQVSNQVRNLRMDLLTSLKRFERFGPAALSSLDRRAPAANLGIVRREIESIVDFAERFVRNVVEPGA